MVPSSDETDTAATAANENGEDTVTEDKGDTPIELSPQSAAEQDAKKKKKKSKSKAKANGKANAVSNGMMAVDDMNGDGQGEWTTVKTRRKRSGAAKKDDDKVSS